MRVVSQSRTISVDFNTTPFWRNDNVIYAKIGNDSKVFGNYSSEERAAEVFEDIHKAYSPYGLIYDKLTEEQIAVFVGSKNVKLKAINMDGAPNCTVTTYDSIVYYMPKK